MMQSKNLFVMMSVLMMGAIVLGGCKPYEQPVFDEVGNSETAYVVDLEDNASERYDSAEALDEHRVATRRIQIPRRWVSTGRPWWTGEYIPTVRVIKVDRAPVTREWAVEGGTGGKDEAIWIESEDSIGFSTGFNCTARIEESNSSRFLYNYPAHAGTDSGRSRLAIVMDEEIRNKVQEVAADYAAGYNLDQLRERKQEMIIQIRQTVIPFFEERGITITTIGMFGGLAYENSEIQTSIDAVFIAQQEKNREGALLEAMSAKEERLRREGVAIANQTREEAQGQADSIRLLAQAEANSITLVNTALIEAQENPIFLDVKRLEVETQRIQAWDGSVPQMIFGGGGEGSGGGFVPMLQIPTSTSSDR